MLRKIVAEDKNTITFEGSDIDLTYILPNLIAMGIPTTGIAKQWRNSKTMLGRFFDEKHKDNYMIWNLTENAYNSEDFHGRVKHVGFLDHHPPRFNNLLSIVSDIASYIKEDPNHVCAVHCRAGRGRTGLVCSCVLMALGVCSTTQEALEYFATKRSKKMKGSTSPPQIRYAYDFGYYMSVYGYDLPLKPIPDYSIGLKSIQFNNFAPIVPMEGFNDVPKPIVYFVNLSQSNTKPLLTKFLMNTKKISNNDYLVTFNERTLRNDCVLIIAAETKQKVTILGRLILHSYFIDTKSIYSMNLDKLQDPTEGVNRNEYHLPSNFELKLTFYRVENDVDDETNQLHDKIIEKVRETPLDRMEVNAPPPLPSKDQRETMLIDMNNMSESCPIKKKAPPPLPPKKTVSTQSEHLNEHTNQDKPTVLFDFTAEDKHESNVDINNDSLNQCDANGSLL